MPLLLRHCEQQDADRGPEDVGELILICERQQLSYDAIARARYRWEHGEDIALDFDTADKLLCGMRMWDAWYSELREYYDAVDLSWSKCECPGCEVLIRTHEARESGGGVKRRYCSQTCRQVAYQIRAGQKKSRQKKHLTGMTHCRSGHKRVPGSFKVRQNGSIECLVCARERAAERRLRKCRKGHEMTAENTIITSNGHGTKTRCRRCFNEGRTAKRMAVAA